MKKSILKNQIFFQTFSDISKVIQNTKVLDYLCNKLAWQHLVSKDVTYKEMNLHLLNFSKVASWVWVIWQNYIPPTCSFIC